MASHSIQIFRLALSVLCTKIFRLLPGLFVRAEGGSGEVPEMLELKTEISRVGRYFVWTNARGIDTVCCVRKFGEMSTLTYHCAIPAPPLFIDHHWLFTRALTCK